MSGPLGGHRRKGKKCAAGVDEFAGIFQDEDFTKPSEKKSKRKRKRKEKSKDDDEIINQVEEDDPTKKRQKKETKPRAKSNGVKHGLRSEILRNPRQVKNDKDRKRTRKESTHNLGVLSSKFKNARAKIKIVRMENDKRKKDKESKTKLKKKLEEKEQVFVGKDWRTNEDGSDFVDPPLPIREFVYDDILPEDRIFHPPKKDVPIYEKNNPPGSIRDVFRHQLKEVIDCKNALDLTDISESEWEKVSRTLTLEPGFQRQAIVPFRESESSAMARIIEGRVFSEISENFNVKILSHLLVRVDKKQPIQDQISKCNMKIREEASKIMRNVSIDPKFIENMDSDHYSKFKHIMRDMIGSLKALVHNMEKPSMIEPSKFCQLTFLDKTVYIWHLFREKWVENCFIASSFLRRSWEFPDFEIPAKWRTTVPMPFADAPLVDHFHALLVDHLRVPDFHAETTETEKNEARRSFFESVEEPFDMRLKEMIGIFTQCVRHASREETWKRLFVRRVLQRQCPELYSYWYTSHYGFWSEQDILEIVHSLDFLCRDEIRVDKRDFVRRHLHELKIEKKAALNQLFLHITQDEMVTQKNSYDMRLKVVEEPSGKIRQRAITGIDCRKCKGDTHKIGYGFQSRRGDEGTDWFLRCVKCGFFEKI